MIGIEPDAGRIREARRALPARLARRVEFRVAKAERLPWHAHEFDCVVFAWAL